MTFPRFSLRLLLLTVAVLCAWLAWERSVVMERRAFRAATEERVMFVTLDPEDPSATASSLSPIRKALGDEAVETIVLPPGSTKVDVARVSKLFPEALVDRWEVREITAPDPSMVRVR